MNRTLPARALALALTIALAAPPAAGALAQPTTAADPVVAPTASAQAAERVMVRFTGSTVSPAVFRAMRAKGIGVERTRPRRHNVVLVSTATGETAEELAARLRTLPGAAWAVPDLPMHPAENVPPSDSAWSSMWWPQSAYLGATTSAPYAANLSPLWSRLFDGPEPALKPERTGVSIAVLDTGYSLTLREDSGDIVPVADLANGDADPTDDDESRHGTRVISVMRAETDNAYGIAGVLHDAQNRVLVYKCMRRVVVNGVPSSTGSASTFYDAMLDAADRGAKVINISAAMPTIDRFGNPLPASAYQMWVDAAAYCADRGAVVVAAAGNSDPHGVSLPAATPDATRPMVIAVGSYDHTSGVVSSFSNRGPEVDVSAPGHGIWTVDASDLATYRVPGTSTMWSGTSFSAPIVSATAALLFSVAPGASPENVIRALQESATDAGPAGRDSSYGYGRMNANAAFDAFRAKVPLMAPLTLSAEQPDGFFTRVSWSGGSGTNRTYRYGVEGGPEYETRSTSATLCLPGAGTWTVRVRAWADDRLSREPATTTVTVTDARAPLETTRAQGPDRYATAVAASRARFPSRAPTVVIASGENWPDALSAAPLAAKEGGPVLLTRAARLPVDTRDELLRLAPTRVYVIGGSGAVSSAAFSSVSALLPGASVTRLSASDRYGTAAAVAARVGAAGGRAVVASGETYADALSGAPVAAANGWPILLTRASAVPASTTSALSALGVTSTMLLGGAGVVSESAASSLPGVTRIWGTTRWQTSAELASWAIGVGALSPERIGLATGLSFPDALAAGPALAADRAPMLLVDTGRLQAPGDFLARQGHGTTQLSVFGGSGAVSYATEIESQLSLRPTPAP